MQRNNICQKLSWFHLTAVVLLFMNNIADARHSIAPAYSYTYIHTTEKNSYHLHCPAVNYTGDLKVWDYRLYFSVSLLFPVWAIQDGTYYRSSDYYSTYSGTDLFIGLSKNYSIDDNFCMIPAVGWHQNAIRLRGKSEYMDFYSLTSGFGFRFMTKYRESRSFLNFLLLSIGMDFTDFLHIENKLKRGYTVTVGLGHTF